MTFDLARLRWGEYVTGVSAVVLLASLFALDWYGLKPSLAPAAAQLGQPTSFTGWESLSHVRWLLLITGLFALALCYFQAARSAPAIPITFSSLLPLLALLSLLSLIYRVLLDRPGSGQALELKAGAVVGLLSVLALNYGGYLSMREEGIAQRDAPKEIETVRLPESSGT